MTKHREEEYAFPCAVIRSNEKTLLSKADLLKVIESKQLSGAMNVLAEFGYGDGKDLLNPRDFERVLKAEQARVYDLVLSIVPDRGELELFQYPNDYHNVKVLLKSEFLGIDGAAAMDYMVSGGTVTPERMAQLIKDRNYIFMSVTMKEAITAAIDLFSKGRDPQEIDIILDKACYKDMREKAKETENEFITGYVSLLIDILNINTFIRLRQINKPWAFFQKVFLEGGEIDERVFIGSYEEPYQQFADKLAPYGFKDVMAKGGAMVKDTGKYTLLEKLCDDAKIKYIRDAKYKSFGIEPVAAFLAAKESEIKNLRMILTGKLTETGEEIMKERLREAYV